MWSFIALARLFYYGFFDDNQTPARVGTRLQTLDGTLQKVAMIARR
jgi:hypothetical protein